MQSGRVVGSAVASVKHSALNGWRLAVVQLLTLAEKPDGEPVLALDTLGCRVGDTVVLTSDGVLMRELTGTKQCPARWVVMGLPDE